MRARLALLLGLLVRWATEIQQELWYVLDDFIIFLTYIQ